MKPTSIEAPQTSNRLRPSNSGSILALAMGGGAAVMTGLPDTAEANVVESTTLPLSPPGPGSGSRNWDVDGDGTFDFRLQRAGAYLFLDDLNGGRLVVPSTRIEDGIAKLASEDVVGSTLAPSLKFFTSAQAANGIVSYGAIAPEAQAGGWSIGDTGFFGFQFTNASGKHFGWGQLSISSGGFTIEEAYYEDEAGKSIAVGDLPNATANADTIAPSLKVKGKKRIRTTKSRVRLRGTASDNSGVSEVTYQIGKRVRKARGTSNWRINQRVKSGRTKLKISASDSAGNKSSSTRVTVIRK